MALKKLLHTLRWSVFFISLFISTFFLAWCLSAQQQFFYPFWYHQLGIDSTIEKYGPQNKNIGGFQNTTEQERFRLFAAINKAVHNDGHGLSSLRFHDPSTHQVKTFLTAPEIMHLQDVAKLLNTLRLVGIVAVGAMLCLLGYSLWRRDKLPALKTLHLYGLLVLGMSVIATLVIGAEKVFYQFHIWIFPPGHPWFFYYQDSLMSTSMQAPNLFGAIAIVLLAFTLAFYGLALLLLKRFYPFPFIRHGI